MRGVQTTPKLRAPKTGREEPTKEGGGGGKAHLVLQALKVADYLIFVLNLVYNSTFSVYNWNPRPELYDETKICIIIIIIFPDV